MGQMVLLMIGKREFEICGKDGIAVTRNCQLLPSPVQNGVASSVPQFSTGGFLVRYWGDQGGSCHWAVSARDA